MELILQKDVKNLGKAGDRVNVRPGYARNYLLPKKLALTLDESRLSEWKHKQQVIEASKKKAAVERDQLLEKLSSVHLVFERESRTGGHLFGSVSPVDISRELEQKHGLLVDKRDIASEPLKTEGEHQIKVALDSKRQVEIKVTVKKIFLETEKQKKAESTSAGEGKGKQHAMETVKSEDKSVGEQPLNSQESATDQPSESNIISEDNPDKS